MNIIMAIVSIKKIVNKLLKKKKIKIFRKIHYIKKIILEKK